MKRNWTHVAAGIAIAFCVNTSPVPVLAQDEIRDLPAVLKADEVTYDRELDIVTARGNVEISQGDRVLRADTLTYNRRVNLITATGNVTLIEPTGDVLFADFVELTDDFRDGIIQNFRALLADQSRLAAVSGRRASGTLVSVRKAVYSPCDLCKTDPTRAPLWQLKAQRVTHDEAARQITYNNAWLEIYGVPVMYTPYFSHPDGTVQRESGFLAPEFGSSSVLGTIFIAPYFQTLGSSADFTFEPMYVSEDNPVLGGQYRERTTRGAYEFNGSITNARNRDSNGEPVAGHEIRGHIKGTGRFDIDDEWRWGFDIARATDDTYLQRYRLLTRYGFLDQNTLTSNLFTERFQGRSYAAMNAYAFQGLRPGDDPGLAPLVLPLLEYSTIGEPDAYGGRFSFDANGLSIYRSDGTRTQRIATQVGWSLPYYAPSGEIYTLSARLLGAVYNVTNADNPDDPNRPADDGVMGRIFPQVTLSWRYPLVRQSETFRTIVEPIVSFTAAPNLGDQSDFPNEDSRSIEFDVTSLFRPNRFTGIDRLEGGQRVTYGINTSITRLTGGSASLLLGQSYRLQDQPGFTEASGLKDQQSDIVGRFAISPHPWLSASYSFQLDKENLEAQRTIAGLALGPPALRLGVSYVFFERDTQTVSPFDIEQVSTTLSANLTRYWRVQVYDVRSLSEEDEGQLLGGASLIYEDECILAGIDLSRRRIGTGDNPPDDTILFRVVFRNLGELRSQVF